MNKLSEFKIFKEKHEIEYQNQLRTYENKINSLNALVQEKENQVELNLSKFKFQILINNNKFLIKSQKVMKLQETINDLNGDFQDKLDAGIRSELEQFKMSREQTDQSMKQAYESQIGQLKSEIDALKVEIISNSRTHESILINLIFSRSKSKRKRNYSSRKSQRWTT